MLILPRRLLSRIALHQTSMVAAGCAFYGTLAVVPALSMLISLYGLVLNPTTVEAHLLPLRELLPLEAWTLVDQQVRLLVGHARGALGLSFVFSLLATLWSASSGTTAILAALNTAGGRHERRSYLLVQCTGLALTLAAMAAAVVALAVVVALPAVASFVGLSRHAALLINLASFALLMGFVATVLAGLYRFGPAIRPAQVWPGAVTATLLWLLASLLFSALAERVFRFGTTYGPLAAAAALMLWLWVSAYATLLGAELNTLLSGSTPSAGSKGPPPSAAASAPPDTQAFPPPPPPSSPVPS
jgi:membrane protein